ncbi:MAG: DUF1365 family protein [Rhizobiaceae bacterium]|nr:DUF1365 family protein [Rhizobiaceae bacterium]
MSSALRSFLYAGKVMHQRLRPRRHRLAYSMFSLLLDLDEIDGLDRKLKLFGRNRFNLFGFYDADHGDPSGLPLRLHVERHLASAGIDTGGGAIRLLAMPRILGYAFNPLSVYFCHRGDATLAAILYEVNNTFGERHSYLIPVSEGTGDQIVQACSKELYVSPFMGMEMSYAFRIRPPAGRLSLHITGSDAGGPIIFAGFSAERRDLTDAVLLRAFFVYPLLTLKVIAGIHWEALLLWLKGVGLKARPAPPHRPVTIVGGPVETSQGRVGGHVVGS